MPRPDVAELDSGPLSALSGTGPLLEQLLWGVKNQVQDNLQFLVILLLLRIVLRRSWLAIGGFVVVAMVMFDLGAVNPVYDKLFILVIASVFIFFMVRFGLLTVCVGMFLVQLSDSLPAGLDFSVWYSGQFFVLLLVAGALLAYGFRYSLAGHSAWAESALEG